MNAKITGGMKIHFSHKRIQKKETFLTTDYTDKRDGSNNKKVFHKRKL
jgi:hypothetical protein